MANEKQGMVDVGDGKLYYEMAGEGKTLVLCHAGFVDSGMWDAQWAEFSRSFRTVRFDMRDYGRSDRAPGPVSRRKDLKNLLSGLGIERAALVGCSMGGALALDFALEHPEQVEALVLVSTAPSGFQMQGEPPRTLLEMISAAQQGDLERTAELQLRIWVDGPFRQPEQVNPAVRQQAAAMNRIPVEHGTWGKVDARPLDPLDPPAAERLGEIHVPTLIVAGALDDPELLRAADVMAREILGAQKVILQGGAHVPNMEQPVEFNRAVLEFLRLKI